MLHKPQHTFHVGIIEIAQAPMEHIHQHAFDVENPIAAFVVFGYVFEGGFDVGFSFTDTLALIITARNTVMISLISAPSSNCRTVN